MTLINPYNFVPLNDKGPNRSSGHPGNGILRTDAYSGVLNCTLKAEGPLISLDHRCTTKYRLKNRDGTYLKDKKGNVFKQIPVFEFLRSVSAKPILQGTSLKGMIRSVFEAITDSCMTLANTTGYKQTGPYASNECKGIEALCPSCRLFGAVTGDSVNCRGRVSFTDAELTKGSLILGRCYLKELSSPKASFSPTYGKSKSMGGPIAGRKFYYHHGSNPEYFVKENNSNDRSIAIDEYAPCESEFSFRVILENLTHEELGFLLLAIELDEGLGHKIGVGKAVGLGSCTIHIKRQERLIFQGADRYRKWDGIVSPDLDRIKVDRSELPDGLVEILRLNKGNDGVIGYPSGRPYPKEPIDALGVFDGDAEKGGRPPWPEAAAGSTPKEAPPKVGPDQQAAWLKEIKQDHLVFVTDEGQELKRKRSAYQGKESSLKVEKWFIVWGDNASRRA